LQAHRVAVPRKWSAERKPDDESIDVRKPYAEQHGARGLSLTHVRRPDRWWGTAGVSTSTSLKKTCLVDPLLGELQLLAVEKTPSSWRISRRTTSSRGARSDDVDPPYIDAPSGIDQKGELTLRFSCRYRVSR